MQSKSRFATLALLAAPLLLSSLLPAVAAQSPNAAAPPASSASAPSSAPASPLNVAAARAGAGSAAASPAQQSAAAAAGSNGAGTAGPAQPGTAATIPAPANNPALSQLTLDQAIAQVIANNPSIVQARIAQQRAHVLVAEAVGQQRPQVSAGAADTYSSEPTSAAEAGQTPTVQSTTAIPIIQDSAFGNVGTSATTSAAGTLSTGNAASNTTSSGTTIVPVGGLPSSGSMGVVSGSSGAGSGATSGATSGGGTSTTTSGTSSEVRVVAPVHPLDTGTGTGTGTTGNTGSNFVSVSQRVNNYEANASVTQILDVFGIAKANVRSAKSNALFSDFDVTRLENDTALNAKDTYFDVLKAVSDVATDTELLNNANAVLRNARINYNAGASPQFDVISAQAQVSSAQAALLGSQNELQVEKAILDNLMNLPTDYDFNPVAVAVVTVDPKTMVAPLVATADAARPEVLQAILTQSIARNLTQIARQGVLPSFGLTGGIDYQPHVSSGNQNYTGFLTASVSVPLYTGGAAQADVRAARLNETNQVSVGVQVRQDVELEVKSALINVITYENLVTADQAAVTEYRDALRIANVRYTDGVGTLLDVTNAQANLANSESNLNSAVFQQQSAYAALIRAQGRR